MAATAFHLLSGSPPFHHSNPAVVISQHLTASPPALSDRRPELSALDPVLAKALAKDPKDRFVSCMDFARALAHRLGVEALADVDRTEASVPINLRPRGGGRHEAQLPPRRKYLRPAYIVPAILAVLLLVAIALVLIQFREIEKLLNDDYTAAAVGAARDRSTRRGAAAFVSADDDRHRPGAGDSCGCRGGRRLFAAGQQRHHGQRQHRLLLDAAVHRRHDLVDQPGRGPRADGHGDHRCHRRATAARAGDAGAGLHAANRQDPQGMPRGHPGQQRRRQLTGA